MGLTFFSHKVIRCLGTTVCKMTAARGFCAEISTAITVAIASRYGAPQHPSGCLSARSMCCQQCKVAVRT